MINERLKAIRTKLNLKQSDVASQLSCASTSFTNWESGKINPPLEQLEKMCTIYGISPLELLDHRPTMNEIYKIAQKPVNERTYEENIALAFCGDVTGWVTNDSSADEEEVIRIYQLLTPDEKKTVLKMLKGLV